MKYLVALSLLVLVAAEAPQEETDKSARDKRGLLGLPAYPLAYSSAYAYSAPALGYPALSYHPAPVAKVVAPLAYHAPIAKVVAPYAYAAPVAKVIAPVPTYHKYAYGAIHPAPLAGYGYGHGYGYGLGYGYGHGYY